MTHYKFQLTCESREITVKRDLQLHGKGCTVKQREVINAHRESLQPEAAEAEAAIAAVRDSGDIRKLLQTGEIPGAPKGVWSATPLERVNLQLRHRFALYLALGESRTLERLRRVLADAKPELYSGLLVSALRQEAKDHNWQERAEAFDEVVAEGKCPAVAKLQARIASRLNTNRVDNIEQVEAVHQELNQGLRTLLLKDVQRLLRHADSAEYETALPPPTIFAPSEIVTITEKLEKMDREALGIGAKAAVSANTVPVEERDMLLEELSEILKHMPDDAREAHYRRIDARLRSQETAQAVGGRRKG